MSERKKVGIVLFQLGGPDSPEAVEPFLYNLFCDPDIIEIPAGWLLRRPLARYIARKRSDKVAAHYQEIGGKSPILLLTQRQARALETALAPHMEARCFIAMRYWHPFTAEAIARLLAFAPDEVVLLPLYPQYSLATTGSSLNEWEREWARALRNGAPGAGHGALNSRAASAEQPGRDGGLQPGLPAPAESAGLAQPEVAGAKAIPIRIVREYHDHPLYIDAVVEKIALSLSHFDAPAEVDLLFSAHGLPVSYIERGDPYQKQIEATVRLTSERGRALHPGIWPARHVICYQSKVGPQQWLEPSIHETIHRLAHEGRKNVLVCPVAFVSEHIETLHEINIETREEAVALGIEHFEMVPSLNDSAEFIRALAAMVSNIPNPA